mmetsp:Transcript_14153/g.28957  ORF Transcript_14153/g.28957 Transcript_14153/m.28957 type:complete len:201 (-) Transcript_14153:1568-2170(-)
MPGTLVRRRLAEFLQRHLPSAAWKVGRNRRGLARHLKRHPRPTWPGFLVLRGMPRTQAMLSHWTTTRILEEQTGARAEGKSGIRPDERVDPLLYRTPALQSLRLSRNPPQRLRVHSSTPGTQPKHVLGPYAPCPPQPDLAMKLLWPQTACRLVEPRVQNIVPRPHSMLCIPCLVQRRLPWKCPRAEDQLVDRVLPTRALR